MSPALPKRVAIYDRNADWALAARIILEQAGYAADAETGDFDSFSRKLAETAHLIAIVNVDSLSDIETQLRQLKQQYPGCRFIITGSQSGPDMERLLRPPLMLADFFLNNADFLVPELPDLCDRLVHTELRIPRELSIVLPDDFDSLVQDFSERISFTAEIRGAKMSSTLIREEFEIILSRMFRTDELGHQQLTKSIIIEPLTKGYGSAFVFKMTPELLLEVKTPKSAVVKFGPRAEIQQEARNYDRFVEWFLTVDQTVRRIDHQEFNIFGAILYSFPRDVTSGYQPLAAYARTKPCDRSLAIIERMFAPDNKHWLAVDGSKYLSVRDQGFQWYYLKKVLKSTPHEMQAKYFDKQFLPAANNRAAQLRPVLTKMGFDSLVELRNDKLTFPPLSLTVPNALNYLQKPLYQPIRTAIAHGDLHANNVLVADDDRYFLIDFFYTDFGHVYRDFIQLELSLRYDLFMSRELPKEAQYLWPDGEYGTDEPTQAEAALEHDIEGLRRLVRLEKAIIAETVLGREVKDPVVTNDVELTKCLRLVGAIRRLAFENFPEDMTAYYQALVFLSLKTLKYWYPLTVRSFYLILAGFYVNLLETGKA